MAFEICIRDLDTGETETFTAEFIERSIETGYRRLDPDGSGTKPPELVETGAKRYSIQAYVGEAIGMTSFADFSAFTDDTADEHDTKMEEQAAQAASWASVSDQEEPSHGV